MKYTATLTVDQSHMSESYDQARRYGSSWYLIELVIGVLFIVGGLALFIYTDWASILPMALIAIGVFETFCWRIQKFFWLRKQGKSKLANAKIEMSFDDEGFESNSGISSSAMKWGGVEKCVRTPKGVLLWPQKGIKIYISEDAVGSDAIEFILSKAV